MNASRLAVLSLGILQLSLTTAAAAPVLLYNGNSAPNEQGWSHSANMPVTVTGGSGLSYFDTTSGGGPGVSYYKYATGATEFVVSINLMVVQASHQLFSPGLSFSAASPASFNGDPNNSLVIGETGVMWSGVSGGSVAMNTTAGFHEYALRYQGGTLDLFIDVDFSDIVDGLAVPALSRTGPFSSSLVWGTIGFGDRTNEWDIDSRYFVDYVKFEDLNPAATPVPEPGTLTLVALGVAGIAARRRRAAKVG